MPWWSWVVIWVVLVASLLGMLAWFGVGLFRKAVTVTEALTALVDQVSQLEAGLDELSPERFAPAIFAEPHGLALAVEQGRGQRARGRQERRDIAVKRGKLLRHAPIE
jgi:hypothetical protein